MADSHGSFLIVRAAGQSLALPLATVVEVLRVPALQTMSDPAVPALLGIMTLRGSQTAVLDLAALLGFPAQANPARIVSVRVAEQCAALAVEDILGVFAIHPESLTAIPLPGGRDRQLGAFDAGFAQILEASGLVDEQLLQTLTAEGA